MPTDIRFKFDLLYSGYSTIPVAIHPQPIGVVQFIGGTFFGTYPTVFYRFILKKIFEQGYTIIAFPFKFTFRHWPIAVSLLLQQSGLRTAILAKAKHLGYGTEIYLEAPPLQQPNYFWIGHGMGCKYIALLELLSEVQTKPVQEVLGRCIGKDQYQQIHAILDGIDLENLSIKNQPSLLIAPDFGGTERAIPVPALAMLFENWGSDTTPTPNQTYCLLRRSGLFNLTGLISFSADPLAASTVRGLLRHLPHRLTPAAKLRGTHFTPLGLERGDSRLVKTVIEFLEVLSKKVEAEDLPNRIGASSGI